MGCQNFVHYIRILCIGCFILNGIVYPCQYLIVDDKLVNHPTYSKYIIKRMKMNQIVTPQ